MHSLDESNNVVAVRLVLPDASQAKIKAIAEHCKQRLLGHRVAPSTAVGSLQETFVVDVLSTDEDVQAPFVVILGSKLPHSECAVWQEVFERLLYEAVMKKPRRKRS